MKLAELADHSKLHHAYLVVGDAAGGAGEVLTMLEKRGVKTSGNLDVLVLNYPDMSVDEVRDVITPFSSLNPLTDAKYCIVSFNTANRNAQNALLKIIEESPGKTHFFFSTDLTGNALPTVRSRCIIVSAETKATSIEGREDAEGFLKEPFGHRLERIDRLLAALSKSGDRADVRAFVRAALYTAQKLKLPPASLRDILDADSFLRLPGSSPKILLSHLAATLPRA